MSFHPDKVDEFKKLFSTNRHLIAGFEGCSFVELLQDEQHSNVFFTYSHWQNESYLEKYRNSELFEKVWGKTKLLFNAKPEAWTVKETGL